MLKSTLALCVLGSALVATSAPAHAGDGTDLLKFVPDTAQVVMVFDMADARDSTLLQKGYTKLLDAAPDAKQKLAELGLDPIKDIDTLLFAGGGAKDLQDDDSMKDMLIIVEGRLPKDKLATMPGATKSTYGGVTIYTNKDTDAAFVGDRVFFAKKGKMKLALDIAANKGKGKGKSVAVSKKAKALRDAIAGTDTAADTWATILVPAKNQADAKKAGMSVKTVSLGVNYSADLAIGLRVLTDSAADATKIVGLAQGSMGQMTQALGSMGLAKAAKSITVTADAATVKMGVTMTEAELTAIMGLAQQFGGMGGGNP
jgi:hypothetical protein